MNEHEESRGLTVRFREALDVCGLTQAALAERVGVSQSTVSMWLRGDRRPDRRTMNTLASELGVSPTWLDYGEGEGPEKSVSELRAAYRSSLEWTFRREQPDGSRDFGNANIFSFSPTIDTFVREVLQNVGDASSAGRARAEFTVRRLRGNDVDTFLSAFQWQSFRPHLEASIRSGQQVGSALEVGMRAADSRDLLILEVADFGTTGLLGPDVGGGNFAALCRNNLDSRKASGQQAGGSYGLGKAVFWRMSSLSTVLFASNLVEPTPDSGRSIGRFIGRSEMVWHEFESGEAFAGPGWFGDVDPKIEDRPMSYWENAALLRDLCISRDPMESGTSILVVGFRDPSSDAEQSPTQMAEQIEAAVVTHFWPALSSGALSVTVSVAEGASNVRTVDVDVEDAAPQEAQMLEAHRRNEVADELLEPGDVVRLEVPLNVPACVAPSMPHPAFTHNATVLVRRADPTEESQSVGRAQFLRGTGMVIFELDLGRILVGAQPFHAAVLCGTAVGDNLEGERAERFLRTAEPPAHNKWDITEKLQREYLRGGGAAVGNFRDAVRNAIRSALAPAIENPPDGPRELASLFKFGDPINPERAPRLVVDSASVNESGAWVVEGTVRVPRPTKPVVGRPVLRFEGETGAGTRVEWTIEPIKDCTAAEGVLTIESGRRTARFRAVSNPATHPVPTGRAAVSVEFKAVREGADA